MNQLHKGKAKYIFFFLITMVFALNGLCFHGNHSSKIDFYNCLTKSLKKNNIPFVLRDTLIDTIIKPHVDTLIYRTSGDTLSAPVFHNAEDSMVFDIPGKRLMLYGKNSEVKYADNELSAPFIEFDQQTNQVSAFLQKDSSGKVSAYPVFIQSDFKSISDTIRFNMKSGKGLIKGTYTQQGELFVYGEKIKKTDSDIFYASRGRFTTCNLDTPHFAFVSSKVKFVNKKMAYTGPVHPEIENVPLPIVLPFGIYPLTQGRHSGFIAPNFTANDQLGMAVEGLGYYKILSDNWDVVARGTLYSYGGWMFNISPRYMKRYRYQGNFSLDVQRFKNGFKGDPDYYSKNTFNVRWTHSADMKARPGVTFTANVNAGSSKFNSLVPNNPTLNFSNQLYSTISYAKSWKNKPFNFSVSANHDQNTIQKKVNIRFPDMNFSVNTLYPFRKKETLGAPKWYENIGIAYNTNAKSLSYFYDTLAAIGNQISKNLQWGASHNVPISLSLPPIGPLQVSPSVSYQERWYQEKFIRTWDTVNHKLDTVINKGFYTARDMSFGIGLSTRIFGMFGFGKNSKVQAIRHEIRPTLSVSYKPNMNAGNFYRTRIDSTDNFYKYSYFERSVYGYFSEGRFGGMNFGLDNVLQMKVRNAKDTSENAIKKVSLLDGLSLNGSYNFLADSFRLSNLSLTARSNLFEKVNITANATFDPYLYDAAGRRINQLIWKQKPISLGTLTSGGVSLQSHFSGGDNSSVNTPTPSVKNTVPNSMPTDEYQQEAAYIKNNPNEFVDFSAPWTLDVMYSLRFSRSHSYTAPGTFTTVLNQDFTWNGNISLTPKWKLGMSGSYNLTLKQLGVLSMNLSRDLHCWQMSITVSPVGTYKFFTINISPKSSMLQDLKINRTRYFYDL